MEVKTLKEIIMQIKKYDLLEVLKNVNYFNEWVSGLDTLQTNNFLSLDINPEEVENFKSILINKNLLDCKDYAKKVEAISSLKNANIYRHLLSRICNPKFLESKNFYKDIEMISKAGTLKYGLNLVGEDLFINSPYHEEDLKLVLGAKDDPTAESLTEVAKNIYSINSLYHKEDMLLISKSDIELVSSKYTGEGLEYLATNDTSLKDKYHLENMQILAKKTNANEFLFRIMINDKIIKGKNYRKEVEMLENAKSRITARALYYYILNPPGKFYHDPDFIYDPNKENEEVNKVLKNAPIIRDRNLVSGSNDPEYLDNLIKINNMDEKHVMHYTALLMNPHFINSPYKEFDLKILEITTNTDIFMDLYTLIYYKLLTDNTNHQSDIILISKTEDSKTRKLLINRMISKYNNNYNYDIEYITRLKLNSLNDEIMEEIKYYLFNEKGINDINHKEKLESLSKGILVERNETLSSYLNNLESKLETNIPQNQQISNKKAKSKILSLFKKDKEY